MSERKWVFMPSHRPLAGTLAQGLGISPVTAHVLINRGIGDAAAARAFLQAELAHLHDPMLFSQMPRAVQRLERALRDGEGIGIFADYDVDGTTGAAVLYKYFSMLGRTARTYVPHRVTEGYGLSAAAVDFFAQAGVKVLITVDCGTNDHAEIERARERGMDVLVVDHHETPTRASAAAALINPKADDRYPFKGITSVGIAFKVAWALSKGVGRARPAGTRFEEFLLDAMGYVALGTVADVAPLVGENRVFVSYGLKALGSCRSAGLRALAERAMGGDVKAFDTFDISFKLAPRLNALGRVGRAEDTLELLVCEDSVRIEELLNLMESANRARREIEDAIYRQAVEQVERRPELQRDAVLVVADERWHVGVVGIVASRLVERFGRPAFVLAIEDGMARGSGRSVDGFRLHEALEASRDLLVSGGGHAKAAGVGVRRERLEEFRRRVNEHAADVLRDAPQEAVLEIDEEVRLSEVTRGLVRELDRLAPFGEGNAPPRLAASHVRVAGPPRLMGKKNDHLSFHVRDGSGPALRAVAFGRADAFDRTAAATTLSLAFRPVLNAWKGRESVELHVDDIKFV
ncbi:MAG: single-stranded-DNA-specific exonuclease RecJ [Planctomycetes bacterium]|nr:single-stranded-DNA-specific exonuclease RecJ [Planctomycetota bacterium]